MIGCIGAMQSHECGGGHMTAAAIDSTGTGCIDCRRGSILAVIVIILVLTVLSMIIKCK